MWWRMPTTKDWNAIMGMMRVEMMMFPQRMLDTISISWPIRYHIFFIFVLFCWSYQSHLMLWLAVNTFKIWSFCLFSTCEWLLVPLGLWSELVHKKTVLGTKNWASKEERILCQSLRNRYPWQQMEIWKQRGQRLLRRQRVQRKGCIQVKTDFWPLWIVDWRISCRTCKVTASNCFLPDF